MTKDRSTNDSRVWAAVVICILILVIVIAAGSRADAACLESTRRVELPDGSIRTKAYTCSLTNDGSPAVRVEFNRLSETAAGFIAPRLVLSGTRAVLWIVDSAEK
jgi:hypothetical protein